MALRISALIFDLDDTLVVEEASAEAAFIETGELAQRRYGVDPRLLHATLRKCCREIWHAFPSHPYCKRIGISSWEGLWAEFTGPDPRLKPLRDWAPSYRLESWRTALQKHRIEDMDLAAELAETFPVLRRQKHVVYDDVTGTLDRLCGRYRLGLLTNGALDVQRRKLEGSNLEGYFDQVLISGEIGIGKPDRLAFETLLQRMNVRNQAALMIGNNLISDVAGAQQAGLRAVWLNRPGIPRNNGILPEWEIDGLDELWPILEACC